MILSPTQKAVLEYMWRFYLDNDQLPPVQVICNHFGWASKTAARDVLAALGKKGFVEKNAVQKHRFTRLFHAEQQAAGS